MLNCVQEIRGGTTCSNLLTERIPGYDFSPMYRFSWLWFSHHGAANFIWLGGAGQTAPLDSCTIGCSGEYSMPQFLGLTAPDSQLSYVFAGHLELYCSFMPNGIKDVSDHEFGHDFFVNPGATDLGHDNRCQWMVDGAVPCSTAPTPCADPNTDCLMKPSREIWSHLHRFDRFDLLCGDSGCPNGTRGCCNAGDTGCTVPGNGSIRQLADPVQGVTP
jgi:hypothetical protein